MQRRENTRGLISKQRGQAMAFVVITMAVVMLSTIFLYKAGKLTSEKMQLQNAADAVAYSVSTLEARDLNFMSYMNRSIVANEVAIGQLIGVYSWANHIGSVGTFLKEYDKILAGPTLGASTSILYPLAYVFMGVGYALKGSLILYPGFVRTRMTFLSRLSSWYGYSQVAFHGTTVMLMVAAIDELVPRNAPGARLSDFGLLSLVGHTASYANRFTTSYNPHSDNAVDHNGYKRLAAMVRSSRDKFTSFRGWRISMPGFPQYVCVDITAGLRPILPDIVLDLIDSVFPKGCIDIDIRLDRLGGSELRFLGEARGDQFNWSAADNTAFNLDLTFVVDFPGWIEDFGVDDIRLDLPALGAPFSAGVAQTGSSLVFYPDSIPSSIAGTLPTDAYGEAPDSIVPWMYIAPGAKKPKKPAKPPAGGAASGGAKAGAKAGAKKGGAKALTKKLGGVFLAAFGLGIAEGNAIKFQTSADIALVLNQFGVGYKGLPKYIDTNNFSGWGYQAPYFIAGLTKSIDRVNNTDTTSPDYRANSVRLPTGRLDLPDAAADQEIAAIAKSEVYFKRPVSSDVSYFARADGKTESGSAFNPYWQARLVDTNFSDRIVSLLLQQQQAWDPNLGMTPLVEPAELFDLPTMVD